MEKGKRDNTYFTYNVNNFINTMNKLTRTEIKDYQSLAQASSDRFVMASIQHRTLSKSEIVSHL